MGKVNENNPAFKLKQEMGVAKSRVVKLKVQVDNELADAIDYIMANSKRATDIEHVIFRLQIFIDEHIYHTRQH